MGGSVRQQQDGRSQTPRGLRTSPTGRVPQWVLDEAVGGRQPSAAWRAWTPAEPPALPARKQRPWAGIGTAVVVVAVLSAAWFLGLLPGVATTDADRTAPSPGVEASDGRLGTPLTPPAAGGTFAFAQLQDDGVTPVAYDPCRPVHYVVRPDNAPYGGEQLITDAVAQMSAVTGLRFIVDGATDEAPDEQRQPFQPDRYGDRWAPVLVTWDTVTEQPDFAADVAGQAGSLAVSVGDGPGVYVTGAVELDAAQFTDILSRPGGQAVARAIVLHEFAHLVGLDHVDDPTQLMYPTTSDVLDFAAGDLAGLSRLGAGACEPSL
ncbi:matrixin family metalloprotease [Modestobacter italicus]|uniref:matrixin family metalloprotease n=1 Tax=Modestobacter italicus (strain DSM 44449 / CECT 9708 / BC 501) TaxID=2732864 RepID=UPI001C97C813|nr:matrixin family metalloprotease [Modestobacter italicus]